jgi:hypothetical protein
MAVESKFASSSTAHFGFEAKASVNDISLRGTMKVPGYACVGSG